MIQKLKEFKQRFKQFVSQLCAHLNNLKNQLSEWSHEHQHDKSLILRITFLHSWRSHTKTWKLRDENANRKNNLVNRTNWVEFRHVELISSRDFSKFESIKISNHDEQILRTRNVSTFQLSLLKTKIFFCVEQNTLKISNFDSFYTRRSSHAKMT